MRHILALAASCLVAVTVASAATAGGFFIVTTWTNLGSGAWTTGANWDTTNVPTAADQARIFNGGGAEITAAGAAASSVVIGGDVSSLSVTGSGELATGGVQLIGEDVVLAVESGGEITRTGGTFEAGNLGQATVRVDGAGSRIDWTGGAVSIGSGGVGVINLTSGGEFVAGTITVAGNGGVGTIRVGGGGPAGILSANVTSGPGASPGQAALVFGHSDNITYAGSVSGVVDVIKFGPGTLTLTGSNVYSRMIVLEGVLRAGAANVFAPAAPMSVNGASQLDLNGFNQTVGTLDGDGTIAIGGATLTTAIVNDGGTFSGVITGSTLIKTGNGQLTLTGANTNASTVVQDGSVYINGNQPAAAVTLQGGTVGGTGRFGEFAATGGFLAPGPAPGGGDLGILSIGGMTLAPDASVVITVETTTPGTGHDRIDVTGGVSLGGATLNVSRGVPVADGSILTIVQNDGGDAITGTFGGVPEGGVVIASGQVFRVSYLGGDGNDVTIEAIGELGLAPAVLPAFTVGVPASVTFTTTGGVAPFGYSVSDGSLPAGLSLNDDTGVLSGTPTTAGPFGFQITSRDALGSFTLLGYEGAVLPPAVPSMPFLALVMLAGIIGGISYLRLKG